jgi:hypothetical protein
MSQRTTTRARRKPERRIRLVRPIPDGVGALLISVGGIPQTYLVSPIASDFGAAYLLTKQDQVPVEPASLSCGTPPAITSASKGSGSLANAWALPSTGTANTSLA